MWFDGIRQPNTIYIANTSRGKDSTAMLRAIELMGWPLDMICSVDIWATQDIPAELPPMVAFKDEYDQKILDWFGIPVTRLCATKRERERAVPGCHIPICSTTGLNPASTSERSGDSHSSEALGVSTLKQTKLTYQDIFYRKVSPKRERDLDEAETAASTVSRRSRGTGATQTSKELLRLPDQSCRQLVYRPQKTPIKGFPWQKGPWCQDRLKGNLLDRVFRPAPERGAENKYRSLSRYRSR